MTALAAIETTYAGCRFRSRLEARWAVALDNRIATLLERLDPPSQERVVGWLFDRYRRPVETQEKT